MGAPFQFTAINVGQAHVAGTATRAPSTLKKATRKTAKTA